MEGRGIWPWTGDGVGWVEEVALWESGEVFRDEELAVAEVRVAGAPPGAMGMSVSVAM